MPTIYAILLFLHRDIDRIDGCVYTANAHPTGVNCLDSFGGLDDDCGPPEIVTGGRDGRIKVWDSRQNNQAVVNIEPFDKAVGAQDCWSVAFGNSYNNHERCVAASFDNGDVKLFDLRQLKVVWETNINHGICQLNFHRVNERMNVLLGSSVQGTLHIFRTEKNSNHFSWDARNEAGIGIGPFAGASTLWFVKHMPQNSSIFATGNAHGHLHFWSQYAYYI